MMASLRLTSYLHDQLRFLLRRFSSSSAASRPFKFQKPATMRYTNQLLNSTSFIGRIASPLTKCNTKYGSFGINTTLRVDSSPYSRYSFHVSLQMWDEMAKLAMEHLELDDYVCVSGHLRSFNGERRIYYYINVKDINFVTPSNQDPTSTVSRALKDEDWKDKYRKKLHLWQVFFSNPIEWRDLRNCKKNARQPDFKHKDTGEALWLARNDPPWVQRQLQLLESRMEGLNFERQKLMFIGL